MVKNRIQPEMLQFTSNLSYPVMKNVQMYICTKKNAQMYKNVHMCSFMKICLFYKFKIQNQNYTSQRCVHEPCQIVTELNYIATLIKNYVI